MGLRLRPPLSEEAGGVPPELFTATTPNQTKPSPAFSAQPPWAASPSDPPSPPPPPRSSSGMFAAPPPPPPPLVQW